MDSFLRICHPFLVNGTLNSYVGCFLNVKKLHKTICPEKVFTFACTGLALIMITPSEARNHILNHTHVLTREMVQMAEALGRVLGTDITAPVSLPPFDNSAMDGYALRWTDPLPKRWHIAGQVPAGKPFLQKIGVGECVRIFTGGALPPDVDTVIQQEWTSQDGDDMFITHPGLTLGANVRREGDQIRKDEPAMKAGTRLSAAGIGFLTALGITQVEVYAIPRVGIIVTGDELVPPGKELGPGQIYESNSLTLKAALAEMGIRTTQISVVGDDVQSFTHTFYEMASSSDCILINGGISVGDHDVVRKFMEERHVKEVFYKVRQRPGKPLFFGTFDARPVFALPGNPASVLSCFYQYVLPGLRKMMGTPHVSLMTGQRILRMDVNKKPGLTFFLKGHCDDRDVTPLDGQLSHILRSFAQSNCLIELAEATEHIPAGTMVTVHLLPNYNQG